MSPEGNSRNLNNRSLGMDCAMSRRDFLNATLLASGGLLLTGASPLDLMASPARNGLGTAAWVTIAPPMATPMR